MKIHSLELVIQLLVTLAIIGAAAYILLAPHFAALLGALQGGARLIP